MTDDAHSQGEAFVNVEGCFNFRDAGGWSTTDGRTMRTGRLYRSDDPIRITDAGRRTVASLGLVRAIDLRQQVHVDRAPGFLSPDKTVHMSLVDRVVDPDNPPRLETPTDITDLYEAMIERSREQLGVALAQLARGLAEGPSLVHCAFGKDRAGLATALVQAAIGVEEASIIADFHRSDGPGRARRDHMVANPIDGDPPFAHLPANLFTAPAETMAELLRRQRAAHGSLDAWAASIIDAESIELLRSVLLT